MKFKKKCLTSWKAGIFSVEVNKNAIIAIPTKIGQPIKIDGTDLIDSCHTEIII